MTVKRIVMLLLFLTAAATAVSGQSDDGPIVLTGSSIHVLDPEGRVLTDVPYATEIEQSPDGRYIVVSRYPQVLADRERMSGATPSDLWLYDTKSGVIREIAGQPDPVYYEGGSRDNAISRSPAVWSPDSSRIAWTEYAEDTDSITLVIHDTDSGLTSAVPFDFGPPDGIGSPTPLWLSTGIVFQAFNTNTITVVAPNGALISKLTIHPSESFSPFWGLFVRHLGRDYFAQYGTESGSWLLTDIVDGSQFVTGTSPVLVSQTSPDTSLRISPLGLVPYSRELGGQSNEHFQVEVRNASGDALIEALDVQTLQQDMSSIAISPDGQRAAIVRFDEVGRVYTDVIDVVSADAGILYTVEQEIDDMTWGAQQWTLPDNAELELVYTPEPESCEATPRPRLTAGQNARVLPGSPNRLRLLPSVSGRVAGQIPEGTTVTLQRGPVCADGIAWWLTEYAGIIGWTAEGADTYFLEAAP